MAAQTTTPRSSATGLRRSDFLSVVIPAFNEEQRVGVTIEAILTYLSTRLDRFEVLVVDDGSTDATAKVTLAAAKDHPELRLVSLPQNRGKGAAVREGVLAARGDLILFSDADLSTPIEELEKLSSALHFGSDIAVGSRALPESDLQVRQPLLREWMGRTFNVLVRTIAFGGMRDTQCGFKLFTRAAARDLFSRLTVERFAFDVEVLALARGRYRVREVPVVWRNSPMSRVSPVGDSMRMFFDLVRVAVRHRIRRTGG